MLAILLLLEAHRRCLRVNRMSTSRDIHFRLHLLDRLLDRPTRMQLLYLGRRICQSVQSSLTLQGSTIRLHRLHTKVALLM